MAYTLVAGGNVYYGRYGYAYSHLTWEAYVVMVIIIALVALVTIVKNRCF
jgi:hypothetical protein